PIPANFHEIYEAVKESRSRTPAPVDTVGCAILPVTLSKEYNYKLSPQNYRFQTMISLMLSAQTKDEINYYAMNNITKYLVNEKNSPDGITIESMIDLDESKLDELIFKVGFHKRKASFIKKTCEIVRDKFGSEIPKNITDITSLPGIGPKMGYLLLQSAWGIIDGIGVDVHVHRLANQWNWVKSKNPEGTREQLESWLPKNLWTEFNPNLVGFGQTICGSRGKKCNLC
ncbi:endonuclease III domain-containing protein, partial [Ascoidea rubescens DSM 1968]